MQGRLEQISSLGTSEQKADLTTLEAFQILVGDPQSKLMIELKQEIAIMSFYTFDDNLSAALFAADGNYMDSTKCLLVEHPKILLHFENRRTRDKNFLIRLHTELLNRCDINKVVQDLAISMTTYLPLETFPLEVFHHFMTYLDMKEIFRILRVSRQFLRVCLSPAFLKLYSGITGDSGFVPANDMNLLDRLSNLDSLHIHLVDHEEYKHFFEKSLLCLKKLEKLSFKARYDRRTFQSVQSFRVLPLRTLQSVESNSQGFLQMALNSPNLEVLDLSMSLVYVLDLENIFLKCRKLRRLLLRLDLVLCCRSHNMRDDLLACCRVTELSCRFHHIRFCVLNPRDSIPAQCLPDSICVGCTCPKPF
jgi:hypothetical protein